MAPGQGGCPAGDRQPRLPAKIADSPAHRLPTPAGHYSPQ